VSADLTIEQLAAQSGMTVRNIRAHQARGLIAPPEVRKRVGYYGPEHVAALQLIRELQDDGFNLASIKQLLSDRERTEDRLARFRASLTRPDDEPAQTVDVAHLRERLGIYGEEGDELLARAERLGVLQRVGVDRYRAPSPFLLALAGDVVASGISIRGALEVFEQVRGQVDSIAAAFVRLFVADVWREFEQAGMPIERWAQVNGAIDRLRPLATSAVSAAFSERLEARIDEAFRQDRDSSGRPAADG
jgi:DNA-binding transcriptional MerR regulator